MNTVGSSVSAAAQQPTLSDVIEQRLTQAEDIHEAAADLKLLLEDHPELNELVDDDQVDTEFAAESITDFILKARGEEG